MTTTALHLAPARQEGRPGRFFRAVGRGFLHSAWAGSWLIPYGSPEIARELQLRRRR